MVIYSPQMEQNSKHFVPQIRGGQRDISIPSPYENSILLFLPDHFWQFRLRVPCLDVSAPHDSHETMQQITLYLIYNIIWGKIASRLSHLSQLKYKNYRKEKWCKLLKGHFAICESQVNQTIILPYVLYRNIMYYESSIKNLTFLCFLFLIWGVCIMDKFGKKS